MISAKEPASFFSRSEFLRFPRFGRAWPRDKFRFRRSELRKIALSFAGKKCPKGRNQTNVTCVTLLMWKFAPCTAKVTNWSTKIRGTRNAAASAETAGLTIHPKLLWTSLKKVSKWVGTICDSSHAPECLGWWMPFSSNSTFLFFPFSLLFFPRQNISGKTVRPFFKEIMKYGYSETRVFFLPCFQNWACQNFCHLRSLLNVR